MSPYPAVCHSQSRCLKTFSCSETPQNDSGLTMPRDDTLTKLCNDVTARIETRVKQQRQNLSEHRYLCQPRYTFVYILTGHRVSQKGTQLQATLTMSFPPNILFDYVNYDWLVLQHLVQQSAQQHQCTIPSLVSEEWI